MLNLREMLSKRGTSEEEERADASASASNIVWCFPSWEGSAKKTRELTHQLTALVFVGDVLLVLATFFLAFEIRFHTSLRKIGIEATPALLDYLGYIGLGAGFYIGLLVQGDIYNSRNLLRFGLITGRIVKSSFVWIGFVLLATFLLRFEPAVSRVFFVIAWILMPVSLIYWRSILHTIVANSSLMAGARRRIAFVGWSEQMVSLAANLRNDPESAYQVVGYFEVDEHSSRRRTIVPCLGNIENFERVLSSASVDVVMLGGVDSDHEQISRIASVCAQEMTELKLLPNYFQNLGPGFELEEIGGIPTMGGGRLPLNRITNRLMKRLVDIVGAAICLVITLPLVFIFGGLVYASSPGPIFYRQRRFGRNGKPFNVIKIRTKRIQALGEVEEKASSGQDLPVGYLMRKWNIDDIPQFWNVLVGEMSLVGPRPERPDLIAIFKYEIAHYNARHNVKPGMTGWAQVNGRRGNKKLGESIPQDLWYLENWSVLLDLKIILMTSFRLKDAE